ncbi:hypothetical protein BDA99DRAFT_529909 [Phascolomyces articulosus]|uniref:GAR domain-containing protein n=1 Tax=Phascolomyces articulosus TaxID=60185 RepID=A0AAD5P717_9FUNG|nr:hypothetical protein BDA99DRAFT_529909 [Phascolomyces articulosus]
MPSFKCMQFDFIHMKLFTATVLHSITDLDHRLQLLRDMNENNDNDDNDEEEKQRYQSLCFWLDHIQTLSLKGESILHAIVENQIDATTDNISALLELYNNKQLSDPLCLKLTKPLKVLDQYHATQRLQQRIQWLNELKQTWLEAHDCVITLLHGPDEKINVVDAAMENATLAYQRWSGASPTANATLYTAMQKQYCEFRHRMHQVADQKKHVDAFIQYTDELQKQGQQLLLQASSTTMETTTDFELAIEYFHDRVHIATERMNARIPYPAHQTLKNTEIQDAVRRRKSLLWLLQEELDQSLRQHQRQQQTHDDKQTNDDVWIKMRMKAVQNLMKSATMSGLTLDEIQQFQKECRDYRITSRKKPNVELDTLLYQLKNNLDVYERKVRTQNAIQKVSADIHEKTQNIWSTLIPLEEGKFDAMDSSSTTSFGKEHGISVDEELVGSLLLENESDEVEEEYAWIQQQHQDYMALVDYGNALLAQRSICKSYQSQAKELLVAGTRHEHQLTSAWTDMTMIRFGSIHHPFDKMTAFDDYIHQSTTFLRQVDKQYQMLPVPNKHVQANRPIPYAPENTFLVQLSNQCHSIVQLSSTVSILVQRYQLALDIVSDINTCIHTINSIVPSDMDHGMGEEKKLRDQTQAIRARLLDAPGCHVMVDAWDKLSSNALSQLAQRIQQHKQTQQQCKLDAAADEAYVVWQKTITDLDALTKGWQDDETHLAHMVTQLETLYPSNQTSFEKMQQAFSSSGRSLSISHYEQQQRVASIVESVHTGYNDYNVMTGYFERHNAWQEHMDVAVRLCDEQDMDMTTLIHNSRVLVTQHDDSSKEKNNISHTSLLPPLQVPDIQDLQNYVDQHGLCYRVEFEKVLAAQLTLDERIQNVNMTMLFAKNVETQCNKICQIMDKLKNDTTMDGPTVAKQIQDPELYPARNQNGQDIEFNKRIRCQLESLLDHAIRQQQSNTKQSKLQKMHDECDILVQQFQEKADHVLLCMTQHVMDELASSAQDCIVHIHQINMDNDLDGNANNKMHQHTIESALTVVQQAWKEKKENDEKTQKQQRNQDAWETYCKLSNWLTQQHNTIQVLDTNDDDLVFIAQQRNKLQELEREGVHVLYAQWHNEKRLDNPHADEMKALYEHVKADHDDLLAALDYIDELYNKKQLEKSRQSFVDGLSSTMRVMTTWAENEKCIVTSGTQHHVLDTIESKACKAADLFRAQIQAYPNYPVLQQQQQQAQLILEQTVCAANDAKLYCDIHLELDEIEASMLNISTSTSLSASILTTLLNDMAHHIKTSFKEDANQRHALVRHDQLVQLVKGVEAREEEAQKHADAVQAQKDAERRRLLIEQAIQDANKDTLAVATVVDKENAWEIHDFYLGSISAVAIHQARRLKWHDEALSEAVCTLESSYACLQRVAEHAKQTHEIKAWIDKWEGQDMMEMTSIIETYLQDKIWDEAPAMIQESVKKSVTQRHDSVQEAWDNLCEQRKQAEAMANERLKEQKEQELLATVEHLIKRAQAQLSHCRWDVDKRDLASMPREPEALAIERRVTDLSATTASLLRQHYPTSETMTQENQAYRAIVDTSIRQFFDTVQDTQCKIAQALAISEYLMISDDIHMMISIFEESLPKTTTSTSRNISKQDLQALEAQQKYYNEHIGQELETAQEIAMENPMLNKPYKQLCDRWGSVQRHVQSLLRRGRVTRGRLTSLPTTTNTSLLSSSPSSLTSFTSLSPVSSTSSSSSSILPSPLASASSPLSPRSTHNNNNSIKRKRLIYEPDPDNQLDVEIGKIVNQVPYSVKVEMVPGEVGRYWFGSRLVYCRILKSRMVMVRVGGGWCELSQFMRDHAMLHDANEMHIVGDEQGFIHMSTARRPSLPPPLYHSSSSSTISTTSTSSSGYYMDGDRYMAVDHYGNYHALKMQKVDGLLNSSGSRSILIK